MGEVAMAQQGLSGLTSGLASQVGWGQFIVKGIFDELIIENIAKTYAVAAFEVAGFEGWENGFLHLDLSAEAIAEQIGESWFDATIGGDLLGAMRQGAGGRVSTQQASENQRIVDEFILHGEEGSAELTALLERAGGAVVARLAAMASDC